MPSPAKPLLPAQGGQQGRVVGEGSSLPPFNFLQAPGCRPSCYSSGLEPCLGAAAARTALAAWRSVVGGGGVGGC